MEHNFFSKTTYTRKRREYDYKLLLYLDTSYRDFRIKDYLKLMYHVGLIYWELKLLLAVMNTCSLAGNQLIRIISHIIHQLTQ